MKGKARGAGGLQSHLSTHTQATSCKNPPKEKAQQAHTQHTAGNRDACSPPTLTPCHTPCHALSLALVSSTLPSSPHPRSCLLLQKSSSPHSGPQLPQLPTSWLYCTAQMLLYCTKNDGPVCRGMAAGPLGFLCNALAQWACRPPPPPAVAVPCCCPSCSRCSMAAVYHSTEHSSSTSPHVCTPCGGREREGEGAGGQQHARDVAMATYWCPFPRPMPVPSSTSRSWLKNLPSPTLSQYLMHSPPQPMVNPAPSGLPTPPFCSSQCAWRR